MTPTQELVLDCYRSPHLLRSLADTAIPLPEGIDKVLRAAIATESTDKQDHPPELREATLLYVKRVMLLDEADHYRILGLRFDAAAEQVDAHYRWLVALLQLDKSISTRELSRRVGRICRAHAVLSDPRRRHAYNKARYGVLAGEDLDLPGEVIMQSIVEDQARKAHLSGPPTSVVGEIQPWKPPQKEAANEAESQGGRRPELDSGETLVFRGPSNGALLAMSGAALLIIFAVSPVIVSRYSAFFMPPEPVAVAPTSGSTPGSSHASAAPAVTETRSAPPAALSFLMPDPDAPVAPLAIFGGGDNTVFERTADNETLAEELSAAAFAERSSEFMTATTATADRTGDGADSAALEPVARFAPDSRETVAVARETLLDEAPAAQPQREPPLSASSVQPIRREATEESLPASESPLRIPLVATASATVPRRPGAPEHTAAPPPVAAAAVPVSLIDSYDLDKLVEQLAATYRAGDMEGFVDLFAENARTNDQPDRLGIAADYQALFQATERRSLQVADVQWQRLESGAIGEGRFVVRLKPKWKKREEVVSGKLTLEVKQQNQGLAITGLFHEYGASPRP